MRLAMVTAFPEQDGVVTGGVEGAASCLVEGLRRFPGLQIHVVSPTSSGLPRKEVREGVTVHWLPMPGGPPFLMYWSRFRKRVHDCLREIAPDVTHFQGVAGWTLGYRHPYVLTVHGISEKGARYAGGWSGVVKGVVFSVVEGAGRGMSDNLIVISPYLQETLSRQLRGERWSIENPVAEDLFRVRRGGHAGNILYVGRLSRLKNVEGVLRSFAKLIARHPEARLTIAGRAESPAYLALLQRYVAENGLGHAVRFPGNLDRASLLQELARSACLVLLSRQETAPMVVEEAMAAGVPVVASRICGIPYLVEEGSPGFLVDPDDEEGVASRLGSLLVDAELNRSLGERSREVAEARFHSREVARRTLAVYQAVCNKARSREIPRW